MIIIIIIIALSPYGFKYLLRKYFRYDLGLLDTLSTFEVFGSIEYYHIPVDPHTSWEGTYIILYNLK